MIEYYAEPTSASEVLERARAVWLRRQGRSPIPMPAREEAVARMKAWAPKKRVVRPPQWIIDAPSISAQMRVASMMIDDLGRFRCGTLPDRVRQIIASVAVEYNLSANDILGLSRHVPIVRARHIAIARVQAATGATTTMLGRWFNRDHSTIVSALKKMRAGK